jgi:hypothetical protein
MRRSLRQFSLVVGATLLLMPQVAIAGFLDFFDSTPSPPIYNRPFAVGTAGAAIQIDLQIKEETGWHFIVEFAFDQDVDRANVLKLLGRTTTIDGGSVKHEPGIDTPVRLEIERLDGQEPSAEDIREIKSVSPIDTVDLPRTHTGVVYAREVHPRDLCAYAESFFHRRLGFLMFKPGKYRVRVTALKNIPEISLLKTSFSILSYNK